MNNVSIIIVHWNTLEKFKVQSSKFKIENIKGVEIIVVDNNSRQDVSWISDKFPHIKLIKNKLNRGFAFACNQGASIAKGDWLAFLNPDVEITAKQILEMIAYASKNKLDAACPKMPEAYSKPLPSAFSLIMEFTPLKKLSNFTNFINFMNFINFPTLQTLFGGCLLIKRSVFMDLGGFDERFFLWFEDSDLTKRLVDKNYVIDRVPIKIKHEGGVSFKKLDEKEKRDIFFNSMEIYSKKHFSPLGQFIVRLIKRRFSKRKVFPEGINQSVSIIVPNVKSDLLIEFFEKNKKYLTEIDDLIVVTSAVKPDKIWALRNKFPNVRFIPVAENRGFSTTVNIGFRVATGKWIGTVNDDVVLTEKWIEKSLRCALDMVGSINPLIYKNEKEIESAGIKILSKGKAMPIIIYHLEDGRTKMVNTQCREVDASNAAAVLYSRQALNKVGLFDERFGSYLEDIDLSLRLKRAGFENIVSTKAKVYHKGAGSRSLLGTKKQMLDFRNWILVIIKNWGIKKLILNLPVILIERLRNFSSILKNVR